jgi:hypothetical protein
MGPNARDHLPKRQNSFGAAYMFGGPESRGEQMITRSRFMAPAPATFITEAFKIYNQLRAYAWLACGAFLGCDANKHQTVGMYVSPLVDG